MTYTGRITRTHMENIRVETHVRNGVYTMHSVSSTHTSTHTRTRAHTHAHSTPIDMHLAPRKHAARRAVAAYLMCNNHSRTLVISRSILKKPATTCTSHQQRAYCSNTGSAGSRLRGAIYYPRGPFAADLQQLPLQRVQEKQWGQKYKLSTCERGYRMVVLTE